MRADVISPIRCRPSPVALVKPPRTQLQEGQKLGEIRQPLCLDALVRRESLAPVLLIEKVLQPTLHAFRKSETSEFRGDLELERADFDLRLLPKQRRSPASGDSSSEIGRSYTFEVQL